MHVELLFFSSLYVEIVDKLKIKRNFSHTFTELVQFLVYIQVYTLILHKLQCDINIY